MGMPEPGTVTTGSASNIAQTSFGMSGSCTEGVSTSISERGFCWIQGTSGTPTTSDSTVFDTSSASGSFNNTVSGLTADTSYRVRAYVVYAAGTSYGTVITVQTLPAGPPTEAPTLSLQGLSPTGFSVLASSVAGASTYEFQVDNVTVQDIPSQMMSRSGLDPETDYDVRCRARNAQGDGPWSDVLPVTTNPPPGPFIRENTFDGGTVGDFVTAANSGGGSGHPWDDAWFQGVRYAIDPTDGPGVVGFVEGWGPGLLKWWPTEPEDAVWARVEMYHELEDWMLLLEEIIIFQGDGTTGDIWVQYEWDWFSSEGVVLSIPAIGVHGEVVIPQYSWHRVEMMVDGTANYMEVRLFLDKDSTVPDEVLGGELFGTAGQIYEAWFINMDGGVTATYLDNPSVSNQGWIGPHGGGEAPTSFDWKGVTWNIRTAAESWGPMYNGQWDHANVELDEQNDSVLMKISNPTGTSPYGCEIRSADTGRGYGTYICTINRRMDDLHKAVVWGGMFTYDENNPPGFTEFDACEASAWGGGPNEDWDVMWSHVLWFNADDPPGVGSTAESFLATDDVVTTHVMRWEAGKVTFDSYAGPDQSGTLLKHTEITQNVHTPANENVRFNMWVFNGDVDPDTTPETTVELLDFAYYPPGMEPVPEGEFELGVTDEVEVEGQRDSQGALEVDAADELDVAGQRSSQGEVELSGEETVEVHGARPSSGSPDDLADEAYLEWGGLTPTIPIPSGGFELFAVDELDATGSRESRGSTELEDVTELEVEGRRDSRGGPADLEDVASLEVEGTRASAGAFETLDVVSLEVDGSRASQGVFDFGDTSLVETAGARDSAGSFLFSDESSIEFGGTRESAGQFDAEDAVEVIWIGSGPEVGGANGVFLLYDTVGVETEGARDSSGEFDAVDEADLEVSGSRDSSAVFEVDDETDLEASGWSRPSSGTFDTEVEATVEFVGEVDARGSFDVTDVTAVEWVGTTSDVPPATGTFEAHTHDHIEVAGLRQSSSGVDLDAIDHIEVAGTRPAQGSFELEDVGEISWLGEGPEVGSANGSFLLFESTEVEAGGARESSAGFEVVDETVIAWTPSRESRSSYTLDGTEVLEWSGSLPAGGSFILEDQAYLDVDGTRSSAGQVELSDEALVEFIGGALSQGTFLLEDEALVLWTAFGFVPGRFRGPAGTLTLYAASPDGPVELTVMKPDGEGGSVPI